MMKGTASRPTMWDALQQVRRHRDLLILERARLTIEHAQLRQQADDYRMEADELGDLLDAATAILHVPEVAAVADAIAAKHSETTRTPAAERAPDRTSRR